MKRIYLASPHMGNEEIKYIQEAFDTNWVAPLGPNVECFENELKEYIHFNKLTPEMLHRLVDRIEIKEDGSPKIYYRFANDFLNE